MSIPDGDGVHGTVCTEDQYQNSTNLYPNDPKPSLTCLTHGQSIGLTLIAESSLLSLVALMFVFVLIGRNVRIYRKALPNGGWKLLQGPTDIYMLSLFVYDVLQAMGGVLSVRWAHNGIVTTGSYCTAQGIIQQIGELGVALITLILTVHTFVVALWNVGSRARHLAFGIVSLVTLFVAFWVGFGNGTRKNFETPTPYWCWVGPSSKLERLAGEYVWMWIALFVSVILYALLYFQIKGRWSVNLQSMLLYPLAYFFLVLPASIARWSLFNHKKVSSAATFFSASVFTLSGAINVLLFLTVRPHLLLFSPPGKFSELEGTELCQPATDSAVFTDPPKSNHCSQPTGIELAEDVAYEV
ncbi:hypothetical protein EI94DRAFT_884557 [Lactarius quietus]|nr:hypothetical protein EI94DRAFT_884557 [Lactarius quietus]